MGLNDQKGLTYGSIFRPCTDKEDLERQEECLNMFSESVYSYLKGGNQTPVLKELAKIETDLEIEYRKYAENFVEKKWDVLKRAVEKSTEVFELHTGSDEKSLESLQEQLRDHIKVIFSSDMHEHIRENYEIAMRQADMHARFNELYRLYHKEEDDRHIVDVFRRDCDECELLLTVVKLLSDKRDMTLKEMEEQGIEKNELEYVINHCKKYFTLRPFRGETRISLNTRGRMLGEAAFSEVEHSDKLYFNISNVLAALEKNEPLELKGLKPSQEKLIRKHVYEVRTKNQTAIFKGKSWSSTTSIIIEHAGEGDIVNGTKRFKIQ